ncbi:unnamed protein product [Hyaloperonospora brassicae]|uniref:Uncharacterized protein n=1 Tax=Hyaloperonospora brassicae TaxID=162125 RepID=A0AAV0TFU8_HYABA|nr:unnamed protein product [Hyaloperonospora brassicae]CAI5743398.1 unnamed protein product [Hyaloperonospora brassicae]
MMTQVDACVCATCHRALPAKSFSRHQQLRTQPKCKACVEAANDHDHKLQQRWKLCVQCFQHLSKLSFSKRQAQLLDAKCMRCVQELERVAAASPADTASMWSFDRYYRVCHRGKSGGVSVRVKHNVASPLVGYIPFGRVFRATAPICNEQGDPMVRLDGLHLSCIVVQDETKVVEKEENGGGRQMKEAWVPTRSIRNEVLLECHQGPFVTDESALESGRTSSKSRFFRCVVEGCKARERADLSIPELGYVLYGDVVEVVEAAVTPDGVVFLRLHGRYFDGAAWVVERSLDNESVLNEVEGPWSSSPTVPRRETYRCVQVSGAPVRVDPELTALPVGRLSCGALVTVVERAITDQRQVFLRFVDLNATPADGSDAVDSKWVIETSTCCGSVMIKSELPGL